jgi:type I restriction enzyme, S subunit
MNNEAKELLEKHFDLAFTAPNGVRKLRELILTFAMQGKLVPQDPNDQPASELLKEIEEEKQRLVKEGKIKPSKPLPKIKPEEEPYPLPKEWKWVKLNEVLDVRDGTHDTPKYVDVGYPLITSKNIYTGRLSFENVKFISEEDHKKISERSKVDAGDILFAMIGSIGNPVIVNCDEDFSIKNVALFKFYLKNMPDNKYLYYFLIQAQENMKAKSSGAVQSFVSLNFIRSYFFPFPPLAEQRRIVAKIDRLMAQCDELENLGGDRNQKRITIHTAAIDRLLAAQEDSDFSTAWDFIQQHFGELYSVKENVAELRKAILQLAVMGKLVPQNPNDEPASELLKAIELEKQKLAEEGEIKKSKPLPEFNLHEVPYQLPKQWEWIRLGSVVISSHAGRSPQCLPRPCIGDEWGVLKVSAVSWGAFDPDENKALPPGMQPRLEDEVKAGDFLLSRANTEELVARSVVVAHTPPNLMISDKTVRLTISSQVNKQFINVAHLSNHARTYYASNASGTSSSMKNVSREIMYQVPIPLPPLAEQYRIMTKIDQLMVLCDELEQQIDAATDKRTELLNALMAQV